MGVRRGDRVGVCMRKSIDAIATIFGILKAGAAYVPLDPEVPAERNGYIVHNCRVGMVAMEDRFTAGLRKEIAALGAIPQLFTLDATGGGDALRGALQRDHVRSPPPVTETPMSAPTDLACVLYTSGSTGRPKGVMLSHQNATSFVDWCSDTFAPHADDRFSSHAPLHFDLSILDLYVSIKHGAALVLVSEEVGKDPLRLPPFIAEQRISIWYSTPSILGLMAQYGKLERYDDNALRHVLFAGEVFPVKHLRALQARCSSPRYFNLYGPTETNVCTFYEIPARIPTERTEPFPIGKACTHVQIRVINEQGEDVSAGSAGELCVAGPGVMQGYWDLPEQTARAVLVDASGQRWYNTGDIVVIDNDGNYVFQGRRDRMVKRRGYRVELAEIEVALYRHPAVEQAAVIAVADEAAGVRIKAFLSGRTGKRPSFLELKRFCAENLPIYMVPDHFTWRDALPTTSTGKVDYQRLQTVE